MKKGAGKTKGRSFERDFCKQLSLWWTEGKRKDVFCPTHGSGSIHTVCVKKGEDFHNSAGDVGYLDEVGKPFIDLCVIELKKGYHKDLSLNKLLDKLQTKKAKRPMVLEVWDKLEKERVEAGRPFSMLIYERDRRRRVVVVSSPFLSLLERFNGEFPGVVISFAETGASMEICFVLFEDFFDFFTPDSFTLLKEGAV